jgi:hypothetical protein
MRRLKLVVAMGFVMVAMLSLTAGPAMADEFEFDEFDIEGDVEFDEGDFDFVEEDIDFDVETVEEEFWVDTIPAAEGTAAFEQWCNPFLPEGWFLAGCIFSEPIEEEVAFFVVEEDIELEEVEFDFEDDFFDKDEDIFDEDEDDGDNEGNRTRIIDRG